MFAMCASAARALRDETEREGGLDVLGQHEDADGRPMLFADRFGRTQTFVGVRRRHADVGDRDIRTLLADRGQQLSRVAGLGDDLEPRLR